MTHQDFHLFSCSLFFTFPCTCRMMTNDLWRKDHFAHQYNGQQGSLSNHSNVSNRSARSSQENGLAFSISPNSGISPSAVCDTTTAGTMPSTMARASHHPFFVPHAEGNAANVVHHQHVPQNDPRSTKDHNFHVQKEKLRQMSLPKTKTVRIL